MKKQEKRNEILTRKEAAYNYLREKRVLWDDLEKLFHNQLAGSITEQTKSQVFDPKLTTLTLERGYRVMAQLPTGKVRGMSKNDTSASHLMNLVLDKYVLPHANAQFDFLTKLRMIDIYSNVYGNFFAMVDWDIKANDYIGPDLWMLNIRDVFPQVGAVSLEDSDYVIVRTWQPLSWFESRAKKKEYKNMSKVIAKLKDKTGSKDSRSSNDISKRESSQYPESIAANKAGYFEVLTQYERDKWTDFSVDADLVFREQDNPHENGELPVVCKYSIPLIDDFMGMGDFERGRSMQNVTNSVWNLYLDAVKMSIFPPALINKDNIAAMSSIKWGAAEKWLVRGQVDNAAKVLDLNPKGIATFNNTYNIASSALLNMFGTTDTTVTAETEAGYGKTPQALQMQQTRENTRDNADRFYMEQFLKKVMVKMVNLISKKQSKAITIRLFEDEIADLKRVYPEADEDYNEKTGKLSINTGKTGSILYDYEMVSGSTYAVDQKSQQENLGQLLQLFIQSPELVQVLSQEGYTLKIGELFKRIVASSGIQDWDKILEEKTDEEMADDTLAADKERLIQAVQQFEMNQVPPQPQGQPPVQQGPPTGGLDEQPQA